MRRTSIILIFFATICGIRVLAQAPATAGPERGTLVLEGGGTRVVMGPLKRTAVIQKFVQLAGGSGAKIVVIPTGGTDDLLTPEGLEQMRVHAREVLGVDHVTVMHTRDRKQADSPEFVAPLRQATGVWITGGKDAYLIDAYVGTRVAIEIKALLARGGVVGGTSAGAAIQGSLLIEGKVVDAEGKVVDSPVSQGGKTLHVDATPPGLGLLTNSFVEPHWNTRNRVDLTPILASQQGLLGIAIDEDTAAIIQGNRLEVFGIGHVGICDGKIHGGKPYYDLSPGDRFDLHTRSPIPVN